MNSVFTNSMRGWICKLQICVRVNWLLYLWQMLKYDWTIFSQSELSEEIPTRDVTQKILIYYMTICKKLNFIEILILVSKIKI